MNATRFLFFLLFMAACARAQSLPPVIERYEQLLIRSPGKGTAFDKVYQHFFEGEGLEKLAARWKGKAEGTTPEAGIYTLLLGTLAERQGQPEEALAQYKKTTELRPQDARAWMALGEAQAGAGRLAEAVAAFQKALAANPARDLRPALFRQLARSQQRAFDAEGALKTWKQFIAEAPDDPFAIEEAADAMVEAERYAEAQAELTKLRDLPGADPYKRVTAIMKLAQIEEKQGRQDAARALYESALPLSSETSWIHREVRARIEEGYRRQDDVPGLVTYYEEWLKTRARDVDAALRLSEALIELNRKQDAVGWLRKAGEWAPDRKEVQVALAKRLGEIGQPLEAVALLTKLTQAHPEEESFREFLGDAQWQVFVATKDEAAKRAAIASWQQLAPAATKDANKVSRVAELLRTRELTGEALAAYARSSGLAPEVPELRQRWAEYLFELKRDEEAWKVLAEMVAGERATAPNFLRLARWQQRRKANAPALESVRKGLALEPGNFELLSLEWRLHSEENRWEEAAAMFDRLLAAAPSVYSTEQVEDGHLQALRSLNRLEETAKQLAARLGQQPPLSEAEMRLLVRITLQNGDLETAETALAEARQRFPDSVALARRQVDYEKRKGNLEARVAALQRLEQMQPKQKVEWLREIARAYQEEGLWDKALAAAQRVIEAAPAAADSFLLAADLNFAAQKFEAGVVRLRDAIKLSDRPNDLRLRLARSFAEAGRADEARQTFDAAFEAESDPKARLAITRLLAEAYLQQGKLDELIGRFRQRQRAEEGGWRYALYLAEIFQQMQDFANAREELAKALGARARDGNFLRQLMKLAQAEGNTMERARFARLLAEAEPSDAHQIDLADALLENGETDAALAILNANRESVLKDPLPWRDLFIEFRNAGAGAALTEFIRAGVEQRPDDWRTRLTLAELQMGMGEIDSARRLLWEIFEMPPEAAAPAPPASASTSPLQIRTGMGIRYINVHQTFIPWTGALSALQARVFRAHVAAEKLGAIFTQPARGARGRHWGTPMHGGFGSGTARPALGSLEEARDTALIYLGALAPPQDGGVAFLGELEQKLKSSPREERLTVFAMLQAREALLSEIRQEAAHPSGDADIDSFCIQTLHNFGGVEEGEANEPGALELLETFYARIREPRQRLINDTIYYTLLARAGRLEEAEKVKARVFAGADQAPGDQLALMFGFALLHENFDLAEKMLGRMGTQNPPGPTHGPQLSWYQMSLAEGLLKKKETAARGVRVLAEVLKASYPQRLPMAASALSSFARRGYRAAWREGQQFPYENRYFSALQLQQWQQAYAHLKAADAMAAMTQELNKHIQSLPNDQSVYTQLARACFQWWDGERGAAIGEVAQLARELKDDDLRMMVASMLAEANQPAEAMRALEAVSATSGELALDKEIRMLALARAANDKERAEEIALRLARMPLDANDHSQLVSVLSELGLREQASDLSKKRPNARGSGGGRRGLQEQLDEKVRAKNEKEAVALARAILARDPLSAAAQQDEYTRRRAIEALRTFKQIGAYRAELQKQLAESPNSLRTLFALAEAPEKEDASGKDSLPYYRKLAELKPDDSAFQLRLAEILRAANQTEEAMRIWESVLARDPEAAVNGNFSVILQTFKEQKQLARVGAALQKTPARKVSLPISFSYGGHSPLGQTFGQVAAELQQEGKPAEAIALWRTALALARERRTGDELSVLPALIAALLETGDHQGALAEAEQFFFPAEKKRPLLGSGAQPGAGLLANMSFSGNGRVDMPALALLRAFRGTAALEVLRAKAAARQDREQDKLLYFMIETQRRDPARLPDLAQRLRAATDAAGARRDGAYMQLIHAFFTLAHEFREWPEARPLALEIMQRLVKSLDAVQGNFARSSVRPQVALFALEMGEQETARTLLKEWFGNFKLGAPSQRYFGHDQQSFELLESMAKLGLKTETDEMLAIMKAMPQYRSSPGDKETLRLLENRLTVLGGGAGSVALTAWAMPPGDLVKAPVICWELGPSRPRSRESSNEARFAVEGEGLPMLDGRYTLELFHGPSESSMRRLATIEHAKSRDSWESPQPLAQGFVLAVAREKETRLISRAAFVPGGPNLLANPGFNTETKLGLSSSPTVTVPGWTGVAPSSLIPRSGGPLAGGKTIEFQFLNQGYGGSRITSKAIPLEPGKNYFLTAWFRKRGSSAQLSGRFLDEHGKTTGGSLNSYQNHEGPRWTCHTKWLVRSDNSSNERQSIPEKAVALELQISDPQGSEVTGLYFGEIDPAALERAAED